MKDIIGLSSFLPGIGGGVLPASLVGGGIIPSVLGMVFKKLASGKDKSLTAPGVSSPTAPKSPDLLTQAMLESTSPLLDIAKAHLETLNRLPAWAQGQPTDFGLWPTAPPGPFNSRTQIPEQPRRY